MFMLLMFMMVKLEQVPFFLRRHRDGQSNCERHGECRMWNVTKVRVVDKAVDAMANVTKLCVGDNAFQ